MSGTWKDIERGADREATEELLKRLPKGNLLLGYQQRTVDTLYTGTALLVVEKSRRIGLTWGLAGYAVLRAATRVSDGGQSAWYMGYDLEMAREFIDVCAMWARAFGIAADAIGEEIVEDEHGSFKSFSIRFSSGLKITALPSVPRALRGKQGIVIIDEAAFHKDLAEVIKSAMALLIWGGQVIIVSTHDGIGNPFNELLDEVRSGRRRGTTMTITFAAAMADGLYERVEMVARTKGAQLPDKASWEADVRASYGSDAEEELDCIPKSGSGALIKPEDIAACEHPEAGKPELYQGGFCYLGRDVARRRDGQIQWTFEMVGDVMWLRDRYEETKQTFAHQDAHFDQQFATRRIMMAGIDQTGMGEAVVEAAQFRHGAMRVVGFLLTGPTRLDLGLSLALRFERGLIRIPPDPIIRADLRAIKKASSSGGGVRLVNDDTVHADRFWAGGIASRLADTPQAQYGYTPVAKPDWERDGSRDDDDFANRHGRPSGGRGRFGAGAW
jgi:phage FluMu gp28-like protein